MKDIYKINLVKNKSLTYMFPLVDSEVNFEFKQFLLNCYTSFDKDDATFCVMYKWNSNPDFLKYEGKLMNHPMYIGHSDFGENVVYKFKLTHVMKIGRELFVQGKYKEFADSHKKTILEYMKKMGYNNVSRITKILDKNEALKSDAPDMDLESVSKNVDKLVVNITSPFSEEIPDVIHKTVKGFGS
tara:strand:+ start:39864 stop:40421 length:558 start_codon:yes stop_codon:yes gene_type:complete